MTSGSSTHGSVMRVERVHLADLLLELADLGEQPAGKGREREEPFLDLDAFG